MSAQDNPKQIAVELGEMLGIEVTEHHISIARPATVSPKQERYEIELLLSLSIEI
jgi:hypothetical protein